jgi:hypothetical protein
MRVKLSNFVARILFKFYVWIKLYTATLLGQAVSRAGDPICPIVISFLIAVIAIADGAFSKFAQI